MSSPFWRVTRTLLLSLRILAFAAMCAALSGCLEISSDDDDEEEIDIVETPTSVIAPSELSAMIGLE